MTQKERLVELYINYYLQRDENKSFWSEDNRVDEYLKPMGSKLADYLLSNGVIVPPCKVGDFVYGIYPVENKEIIIRDWIFAVGAVDYESLHLIYKTEQFCFDEDSIGEDVFMNFEEAEQALKERDEK